MNERRETPLVAPAPSGPAIAGIWFARLVCLVAGIFGLGGCGPNDTIDREHDVGSAGGATGDVTGLGTGGAPAEPPPPAVSCGEAKPWMVGGAYKEGSLVAAGSPTHLFQCRPWPNSGWCPMAAYEPGKPEGYWKDAWTDHGPCP